LRAWAFAQGGLWAIHLAEAASPAISPQVAAHFGEARSDSALKDNQ